MKTRIEIILFGLLSTTMVAWADTYTFGTSANQFSMDFVNIGYAGNVGQTQDYGADGGIRTFGSVGYDYQIGKFEVTINQFSKARNSSFWGIADGDEDHWNSVGSNAPATFTFFSEAAKFCNWLTSGDSRYGAYGSGMSRASAIATYGTVFVIPTEDEWYKAAYFKSDGSGYTTYAHGDAAPAAGTDARYGGLTSPWEVGDGTVENNGTFDMDGNAWEIFESPFLESQPTPRGYRGGSYDALLAAQGSSIRVDTPFEDASIGFRVAVVPEPSSVILLVVGSGGILFYRRTKRRAQENRAPSRKDFC